MNECPVCDKGRLVTKLSKAGEETFCADCRRIIVSASLGFNFKIAGEEGIEECKGPSNDPRPGFKGPGSKAKCYLYDAGNEESEKAAKERAKNAAYSAQHRKAASKIVATDFFGLTNPGRNLIGTPTGTESQESHFAVDADHGLARKDNAVTVTAPSGIQPGNLNGANPLNSGTTANKKIAELINEFGHAPSEPALGSVELQDFMGPGWCTEHNQLLNRCNHSF